MKGAFEYQEGKIIVLVEGDKNIRFIDRAQQKEDMDTIITNLSN